MKLTHGLLFLSLLFNVFLLVDVRRSSGQLSLSIVDLKGAFEKQSGARPSDSELLDMVNKAVKAELDKAKLETASGGAGSELARINTLQSRLDNLQAQFLEKAKPGGNREERDAKIRKEVERLKSEVIAACR